MATDIIARGMAANAQAGSGVTEGTITNALGYKPVSETDVNNVINNSSHLKRVITTTLPDVSKADKDTIYMIQVTSAKGDDKYQEYMLIDGSLQMIGDTSTDLTDYAKIDDVNSKLDTKVDKIDGKSLSTNDYTNADKSQVEKNKADISTLQSGKVDKIEGKGLSTNDYTNADKSQVEKNKADISTLQSGKVDKIEGKGLSTNDYTNADKSQVEKNKADISTLQSGKVDKIEGKGLSTNDYTNADKSQVEKNKADISTLQNGKIDKVSGKGLSTNDLTDDLKSSYDKAVEDVADIKAVGGEPNKIDSISVNGTTISIDSKKNVNIETITSSDVKSQVEAYGYQTAENVESTILGKGYQTSAQVQSAINTALSDITGIDLQVVSSLPTTGTKGIIYLVAHSHSDEGDSYDEYVWVESNSSYEKIGNTDVDLSAYVKASDISIISESELEAMWNA